MRSPTRVCGDEVDGQRKDPRLEASLARYTRPHFTGSEKRGLRNQRKRWYAMLTANANKGDNVPLFYSAHTTSSTVFPLTRARISSVPPRART